MTKWSDIPKLRKKCREEFEQLCEENKACIREVLSARREKRLVLQRRAIAVELRQRGYSYPIIGYAMNRDHTTILHHIQQHEAKL